MGRVVTGLILAAGWLLLLFVGTYPLFCLVVVAAAALGLYELWHMSAPEPEQRFLFPVLVLGIVPAAAVSIWGSGVMAASLFSVFLLLALLALAAYPSLENGLLFVSRAWFAVFYVGFCATHLILLYSLAQGSYWLLYLTAVTVFSDTGAYYAGRIFGKVKLYPALSPGKTRAGAAGGILGGVLGGLAVGAFFLAGVDFVMLALLGLGLSVVGIAGDLLESLVKRAAGVKDSGTILPGHGGVLDRCDSLLLTAPALYYVLYWGEAVILK
jgi:phosphatidate cytidylyltransferase